MFSRKINNNMLELLDERNSVILSIKEELINDTFLLTLSGQMRNETAHDFEDELTAAVSVYPKVVIDLASVDYIASMSMKALLSVQQIMDEIDGASLTLTNVSDNVMNTLKEFGFDDMLLIEE